MLESQSKAQKTWFIAHPL